MRIFWDHQKEALTKHPNGMRWHPLMIRSGLILVPHRIFIDNFSYLYHRWCLYLRHQSSKAYDTLREGGIALPSQRTLRDYTYSCKAKTGFSNAVDQQLLLASRILTCEEWQKYVVILVDEMYIRYVILRKHCISSSNL